MTRGYGFRTGRHDYLHPLKYYRVVRKFIAKQQDLSEPDLEALIQLDDEYFSKKRFKEATLTQSWKSNRLDELIEQGWIEKWRDRGFRSAALYKPTGKSHRLVRRIYKILAGEEDLPMSSRRNPLERNPDLLGTAEKMLRDAVRAMDNQRKNDKFN